MHDVVGTWTNFAKLMTFLVPIDCVRFGRYGGKLFIRHRFPCGGLSHVKQATSLCLIVESKLGIRGSTDRHKMQQK